MKNLVLLSLLTLVSVNAFAREGHESSLIARHQEIAFNQQSPKAAATEPNKAVEAATDAKTDSPCNMPCCS